MQSSRDILWNNYDSLRAACSNLTVREESEAGRLIRKGLYVTTFNLFEEFIEKRWIELAHAANNNSDKFLNFNTLFEDRRESIIQHCLEIAAKQITQQSNLAIYDRLESIREISSRHTDYLLPIETLSWTNSNVTVEHFANSLALIGLDKIWDRFQQAYRFTIPKLHSKPQDPHTDFEELLKLRHEAAHEAQFIADTLRLNRLPDQLLRLSIAFDLTLTEAIRYLCTVEPSSIDPGKSFTIPKNYTVPTPWFTAFYNPANSNIDIVSQTKDNFDLRREYDPADAFTLTIEEDDLREQIQQLDNIDTKASHTFKHHSNRIVRYAHEHNVHFLAFYVVHNSNYRLCRWITC